ncbi:thiolase family protein [Pseudonocardia spinosispora]|uniref:thiolase family protein n=1 Tax=Pseudonocardia spinosispora TaxID=103441 RepID=UPI00048BDC00|nr:thiolase family protein [Pseudonocardia spinosispora]
MSADFTEFRPVYVVGVGIDRYRKRTARPYVELGLAATREALADAGLRWSAVESAYIGTALLGMASGRPMLKHLGATGLPITHVENASATGAAAFRLACLEVATGVCEISAAIGVDKPVSVEPTGTGVPLLADEVVTPATHFSLLTELYLDRWGVRVEDLALVAVKNSRNGARNPHAHRQTARSLADVLHARPIAGHVTALQCCPVSEGAAAVIVASEEAIRLLGLDTGRAIRVAASAASSERVHTTADAEYQLTAETTRRAMKQAAVEPGQLDVIELHDAFAIEEPLYLEAMGVCDPGRTVDRLKSGEFDIGGSCAVSPSGGLLAMGHPIGPTGLGQIAELTRQLRGEADTRQQPGARIGLAHLIGLGAVCYAHILMAEWN